jgi:hypothetical protein
VTRAVARQDQFGGDSADGVAMNANGGEARRDQPAHFQIAKADEDARPERDQFPKRA